MAIVQRIYTRKYMYMCTGIYRDRYCSPPLVHVVTIIDNCSERVRYAGRCRPAIFKRLPRIWYTPIRWSAPIVDRCRGCQHTAEYFFFFLAHEKSTFSIITSCVLVLEAGLNLSPLSCAKSTKYYTGRYEKIRKIINIDTK